MIIQSLLNKKELNVEDFFEAFSADVIPFEEFTPFIEEIFERGILIDFNDYDPSLRSVVIDGLDRLKVISEDRYLREKSLDEFIGVFVERCRLPVHKTWIERRIPREYLARGIEIESEVSHIIDFFTSSYARELEIDKSLLSMDYQTVVEKTLQWNRQMLKNDKIRPDDPKFVKLEYIFGPYSFFRLLSLQALDHESDVMGHCVGQGGYDEGVITRSTRIYSLRSPSGESHATIELTLGSINQIRGRGNDPVLPKYVEAIIKFIQEHLKMKLEDLSVTDLRMLGFKAVHTFRSRYDSFIYPSHLSEPGYEVISKLVKELNFDNFLKILAERNSDWTQEVSLKLFNQMHHIKKPLNELSLYPSVNYLLDEFKDLYEEIGVDIFESDSATEDLKTQIKTYLKLEQHRNNRSMKRKNKISIKPYYSFLINLNSLVAPGSTEEFILQLYKEDFPQSKVNVFLDLAYSSRYQSLKDDFEEIKKNLENQPINELERLEKKFRPPRLDEPFECAECSNYSYYKEQEKLLKDIEYEVGWVDSFQVQEALDVINESLNNLSECFENLEEIIKNYIKIAILGREHNLNLKSFIKDSVSEVFNESTLNQFNSKETILVAKYHKNRVPLSDQVFDKINDKLSTIYKLKDDWDSINSERCQECSGQKEIESNRSDLDLEISEELMFSSSIVSDLDNLKAKTKNLVEDIETELEDLANELISYYEDL